MTWRDTAAFASGGGLGGALVAAHHGSLALWAFFFAVFVAGYLIHRRIVGGGL